MTPGVVFGFDTSTFRGGTACRYGYRVTESETINADDKNLLTDEDFAEIEAFANADAEALALA